jgi:leader peptidase (prepilin peptidase)/N-methyltransferase
MAIAFWLVTFFLIGAAIGSFLNVCVARLPYEKSIFWPASRCASCLQPVQGRDNIPLISYWALRGRCRICGARFSIRYFLVELFTALLFAGLFYLLVIVNVRDLNIFKLWGVNKGMIDPQYLLSILLVVVHHLTLIGFLLVTSLCDLSDMEIPLPVTVAGTIVGLIFAVLLPWPEPTIFGQLGWGRVAGGSSPPFYGAYAWPVWYPLPDWLPEGSWQLGLATGLAGALAGMILLRGVAFLFWRGRGIEGLGMGDADLMMMAGAFVGWQVVVIGFFASVFPALLLAVVQVIRKGDKPMPFGPSLAAGVVLTLMGWPYVGPHFAFLFLDAPLLGAMAGAGAFILLVTSFMLRLLRGTEPAAPT